MDNTTSGVSSTEVGISRFAIEGFTFIAEYPFVFVHCHIRICDVGNPNSRCAQGCIRGTKEKRDVKNDDRLYALAQGPLTIYEDMKGMNTKLTLRGKYADLAIFKKCKLTNQRTKDDSLLRKQTN